MNAIWNWLFLLSCAPADKSTAAQSFIIRAGFYFLFFEVDFVIKALSLYIYERLLISLMLLQLYSSLLCCVLSFHFPVYRAVKGLCPFFSIYCAAIISDLWPWGTYPRCWVSAVAAYTFPLYVFMLFFIQCDLWIV